MFGKSKTNPKEQEMAVLQSRVTLRRLEERYRVMLERELRTVRALKAKNMENASNDSKIRLNYYMLQVIRNAQERLSNITDMTEVNQSMSELNDVLQTVNRLSTGSQKGNGRKLVSGIDKMNKKAERDKRQLDSMSRKIEKSVGNPEVTSENLEEMLSNGVKTTHEAEDETELNMEVDMEEIDRYLEQMYNKL